MWQFWGKELQKRAVIKRGHRAKRWWGGSGFKDAQNQESRSGKGTKGKEERNCFRFPGTSKKLNIWPGLDATFVVFLSCLFSPIYVASGPGQMLRFFDVPGNLKPSGFTLFLLCCLSTSDIKPFCCVGEAIQMAIQRTAVGLQGS